jgi:hypothetical protein
MDTFDGRYIALRWRRGRRIQSRHAAVSAIVSTAACAMSSDCVADAV